MPSDTKTCSKWGPGVAPAYSLVTSGHATGDGDTSPKDGETRSLGGDTGAFKQVGGDTLSSCQDPNGDTVISTQEFVGDTAKPPQFGDAQTPYPDGDTTRLSIDRGVSVSRPHSHRTLGHYPHIGHTQEDPGPQISTETIHVTPNACGSAHRFPSLTYTHDDSKTAPEATPTSEKLPPQLYFSDGDDTGTPGHAEGDKTHRHPTTQKSRHQCRYPWRRVKHRQLYRLAGMSLAYCLSIVCIGLYKGIASQGASLEDDTGDNALVRIRRQAGLYYLPCFVLTVHKDTL